MTTLDQMRIESEVSTPNLQGDKESSPNLFIEDNQNIGTNSTPPPAGGAPVIKKIDINSLSRVDKLIYDYTQKLFSSEPKYNELEKKIYLGSKLLNDDDVSILRANIDNYVDTLNANLLKNQKNQPYIPKDRVKDILTDFSKQLSYHPFKDFVESDIWDGTDHLSNLFKTIALSPDYLKYTKFYENCFKKFFVGIVSRVYKPSAKNFVLVLQGSQGIGKTRWCDKLLPVKGAYAEGAIDPERQDNLAYHTEKLLWHIAEFDAVTGKKDVAALKAYVDMAEVTFRRPYDKYATTAASQLSFIASVNTVDFLKDTTGSRRYIVLPAVHLNANHDINMQQVYAQSKYLMDNGFANYLTKNEEHIQSEINSNFGSDSTADLIFDKITIPNNDGEWMSTSELIERIASDFFSHSVRGSNRSEVRNKLENLGFKSKSVGKSAKKYFIKISKNDNLHQSSYLLGESKSDEKDTEENITMPPAVSINMDASIENGFAPSFRRVKPLSNNGGSNA